jgi:lauroyl/myristoyl acyltransferase
VYRPLDFGPAERFVRWSRSRCGMEMVSRKESLLTLRRKLTSGMNIMILFDQNAGKAVR